MVHTNFKSVYAKPKCLQILNLFHYSTLILFLATKMLLRIHNTLLQIGRLHVSRHVPPTVKNPLPFWICSSPVPHHRRLESCLCNEPKMALMEGQLLFYSHFIKKKRSAFTFRESSFCSSNEAWSLSCLLLNLLFLANFLVSI